MGMGGMGNPAMRGQNPYGGGYGGGGLGARMGMGGGGMMPPRTMSPQMPPGMQQPMGMGGRFPTPNGQFGNPAYGMGGRFGGGMQWGGPTAMPKPFGGGAMQGQSTGGGVDTFGQGQPNPAMRQLTGGADTFGQSQPTPSLLGGGQGQPPPMQDFGNWLNDYRTRQGDGFTGTRNGQNFINGNLYAAEGLSQGTDPNTPDFAFQNILNAYAPQISQLGGAASGAPSLGGATSPAPSMGGATPPMDPAILKSLLGGMFSR